MDRPHPSDPGIALVELLAWLSEMLLFTANQLPESRTRAFLALLDGADRAPGEEAPLGEAIAATMRRLHERYRAATPYDYEQLALHTRPGAPEAAALGDEGRVRRVRVPRRNLATPDAAARADLAAAHGSLVVLPEPVGGLPGGQPVPSPACSRGCRSSCGHAGCSVRGTTSSGPRPRRWTR